ncbi:MAG TPA: PAS domain-containing protein [Hypericibacter adhaerens]|uniref:PAS domain-containing protein n=1 Tax=Hypericibacter adhaerens TaxID=2602016 RepID=UPI002BEA5FB6|nr:PAS domain-containing protein [Hypericibacter adhaerens]HWA45342.1 PAS domain-containing protein [Hypericibacter adhaerens]
MTSLFWDERLETLLAYWNLKRGDRPAPSRRDIDPRDIARLLPCLHLIDVEPQPLRFRHRLVGSELIDMMGRNVTGQYVGDGLYGRAADEILETMQHLTTQIRPFRRRARLEWHRADWLTLEALELPLIDENGQVNMLLCGRSFSLADPPLTTRLNFDPLSRY